jgi:exosortase
MNKLTTAPKLLIIFAVLGWVYWPTFRELYETWSTSPDYSHGFLVPFFAAYLLWRKKDTPHVESKPWPILGFSLLTVAVVLRLLGAGTSFLPLEGLSFVFCLTALVMVLGGRSGLVRYWAPLVFLLFMLPLPYEASRLMGAELQRIATIVSTFMLQCLGQPAIAEGNRILIEDVQLNVVEACSGLRMLMTFIAFCVAAVMMMQRHWLVKGIVLGSAIPIALFTNILRITATGIAHVWLHDSDRKASVMDFIHDFNGWMMMPIGLTMLLAELWVLKHLLIERATVAQLRPTPTAKPLTPTNETAKPRFASVIQMS